jgi:AAA+ superfamily predicted ATPase
MSSVGFRVEERVGRTPSGSGGGSGIVDGVVPASVTPRGVRMPPTPSARLDAILALTMAVARDRFGPDASADPFRGLHVSPSLAEAALDGRAGEPLLGAARRTDLAEDDPPPWDDILRDDRGWAWLQRDHGLSERELDIVLIALAPEIDLRYERVYGYLQDDVTRRRPSVNLALDLVTDTVEEKRAARADLGVDGVLLGDRLLSLVAPPGVVEAPLLAHVVVPDVQIVDVLLGQGGMSRCLAPWCRLSAPAAADWSRTPLQAAEGTALVDTVRRARSARRPLRLHFRGPRGTGRTSTAQAVAGELAVPLLTVEVSGLTDPSVADDVLLRASREAILHGGLLYLEDVDSLTADPRARQVLHRRLAAHQGCVILAGTAAWAPDGPPLGVVDVAFGRPTFEVRRRAWARSLAEAGVTASAASVEALAGRFGIGPARIADAVATAVARSGNRPEAERSASTVVPATDPSGLTGEDLVCAARAQTRHHLAGLTRMIEPRATWDDLVVTAESLAELRGLCHRVVHAQRVWHEWGFAGRFSSGTGATALFTGPPGTGKTMAGEVVARELGLDLFAVDLSSVVSKYIGETEKNLERIFTAAAGGNAVLMFDEADALFGKRSEVRDSHDRYANIQTSYLLQRMEQYDGVAVLTTNVREHLDGAFVRRLQFIVDFPFPDETCRARIWRGCLPTAVPCADDLDLERLGRDFRLSGGGIRNAALHGAFLAAEAGVPLGMAQLVRAIRREHRKAGTVLPPVEADQG